MSKWKSFVHESKSFQVVRFLNVVHQDSANKRDTEDSAKLSTMLDKMIKDHRELQHYIDIPIRIWTSHRLYSPSQTRSFKDQNNVGRPPKWVDYNPSKEHLMHPLYVLICSSLNEATDARLREQLSIQESSLKARIEAISYYVYERIRFHGHFESRDLTKENLALLFFQVSSADDAKELTDPGKFFKRPLEWDTPIAKFWTVAMCGMLRGDVEGFMLFSSNCVAQGKNLVDELKKYLRNCARKRDGFFGGVSPLVLYFGEWETKFDVRPHNLIVTKEIADSFVSSI